MTTEVRLQVEDNMSETSSNSSQTNISAEQIKRNMLPWKIMCALMMLSVTIGWIGMIALLIIKEEWQLVLVAWLMLYAAVHFCYWYCRRNSSRNVTAQLRRRFISHWRGTSDDISCPEGDCPPSYDELVKNELPPPAYYSVVEESPKLKRGLQSLALPWFLKKKSMEAVSKNQNSNDVTVVVSEEATASTSAAVPSAGESSDAWKSSATGTASAAPPNDGTVRQASLPSYETLIQQNQDQQQQPVMTPIHQALTRLPTPPPPYSPRKMETITEQQCDDE